ncbi:hypothetical protein LPJ66_004441 [Kickxella alabastrina]|uniref:Uncharacterized protein n=1 Tax=Kickxella alabastrina TaxID=61397 RepID=A0ACC1IIP4_9FUNG|nr:hypothetical protein LPJ66_004441 [Kickxella alabastrina]
MSGFIFNELLDKLRTKDTSTTRFGSKLDLRVATANAQTRTITYEYAITSDEVYRGYLDSGWLSTVVENATDPLICAATSNSNMVTSSLTVNTLEPVMAGVVVEIVCRLVLFEGRMVQAVVTFRDARRRNMVYAAGVHTLIYKEGLAGSGGGAKL